MSKERSKAGTKKGSPEGLSQPNQNTIIINIMFYYLIRYECIKISMDQQIQMWKIINFELRNKVSQRITRSGSDLHRLSKNSYRTKSCLSIRSKAVEFNPDEYRKFKYHRNVQKPLYQHLLEYQHLIWYQPYHFPTVLINFRISSFSSYNLLSKKNILDR